MRLLVLGGTGWLGSEVARQALAAGHEVAVLPRGRHGTTPEGAMVLTGDRAEVAPLAASFAPEAVLDTCAYLPEDIAGPAALQGRPRYLMVSSISIYGGFPRRLDENDPPSADTRATAEALAGMMPEDRRRGLAEGGLYGPGKWAAEAAARAAFGGRATILRPGLICGPGDPTWRTTWWLRRLDAGGRVPVPLPMDRPVQVIDLRDLAAFALRLVTDGRAGTFNATGPALPFAGFLDACREATGHRAEQVWLTPEQVAAAGVAWWSDLPLCPGPGQDHAHLMDFDPATARAAGLACRPLAATLHDILDDDHGHRDAPLSCGLPPAKEAALLALAERD